MGKIRFESECYLFDKIKYFIFILMIYLSLLSYLIFRKIRNSPESTFELLFKILWLAAIVCLPIMIFLSIRIYKDIKHTGKLTELLSDGKTEMCSLSSIQTLYSCNKKRAVSIINQIINDGYYSDMTYDPVCEILFFTKKSKENYESVIISTDGRRLSEKEINSMEELSKIMSAIEDYNNIAGNLHTKNLYISEGIGNVKKRLKKLSKLMTVNMADKSELHKLYTYYIPTLCCLIQKYNEYTEKTTKDFSEIKGELIETLENFSEMLDRICKELSEDDELELSVEMSAMKKAMVYDGYREEM